MPPTLTTNQWRAERATELSKAKAVLERAKVAGRDLTVSEEKAVTRATDRVKDLDIQIKGRDLVNSVMSLGTAEDDPDQPRWPVH